MNTSILVTGATGFIGSALVRSLAVQDQYAVRAVVRQAQAERALGPDHLIQWVTISNLAEDPAWLAALSGVVTVVHCAALSSVPKASESAVDTLHQVNVEGARRLAEACALSGVKRLVFLSSVKVHGEGASVTADQHGPITEQSPFAPEDAYARSKMAAETALLEIAARTGLEVVILRPPLVYGPGAKGNFAAMVRALERGWPLPLGAVTHNRRSFVALDNLIDLIRVCLDHPSAAGEAFLVSDGEDVSTAEFLRRTARAMDRKARLVPVPVGLLERAARLAGREAAAQRLLGSLQIDSSKARKVLGWAPPVTMDEGLRRAVGERVHG